MKKPTRMVTLLSLCLMPPLGGALGCGGGNTPAGAESGNVSCDGQERLQLDCSGEFNYDATDIEGGFSAIGIGSLDAKTEQKALREIDQQTEQYVAQSRRLCDEYNKCVIDRDTYSLRSENLRRRMAQVPELYDQIKQAVDPNEKRKLLASAYRELVPESERTELVLQLSVMAQAPGQTDATPIAQGATLASGTRVAFSAVVSHSAHVYLFQKSPSGELNVLFPDARIPMTNPIPAGTALRIPQGGASFKLDDKDIGLERVFVVASLNPVESLGLAVAAIGSGAAPGGKMLELTEIDNSPACATRALNFEEDAPPQKCTRQRGLSYEEEASTAGTAKPSLVARTEAADSLIAQVFSFQHTR
ncbi:MAG: hypothetical protein RJA70_57 [Pseudomonadota bacterium]|jgi:hypothetical protein